MTTRTLMLGDVDIGSYVKTNSPIKIEIPNESSINKIKTKLNEIKKDNLSFERFFIEMWAPQLNESNKKQLSPELNPISIYPEIDLSFLNKGYEKKREDNGAVIGVPTFSVYPFYGENKFSLTFDVPRPFISFDNGDDDYYISAGPGIDCSLKGFFGKTLNVKIGSLENEIGFHLQKYLADSILKEKLEKKDLINNETQASYHWKLKGPQGEIKKYKAPRRNNLKIESRFNGLIPNETKMKVKEATLSFKKEDIYLVAETKPEQWNIQYIATCPLIVGMKDARAYIIDHFNCTPLENLVKDNYVGRMN